MTLKNAALLALIGTILATVLLVWTFVSTVLNVLRGVTPAGDVVPVVRLFVCLFQRGCLLLCVPENAVVIVTCPPPAYRFSSWRAAQSTASAAGHCEPRCPKPSSARPAPATVFPRVIPV